MQGQQPAAGGRAQYRDPDPFSLEAQGQDITVLPDGDDRRKALLELVSRAESSLKVAFYIFADDGIGKALRDALCEACERGVKVTLIIDDFGASVDEAFLTPLKRAGGEVMRFAPRAGLRYLIRNHQKMAIADDERAMFGGFNVEDDYFAPPQDNGWNDLGFTIEGEAVAGLVDWFSRLVEWTRDDTAHLKAIRRAVRSWDWAQTSAGEKVRWLVGGPTRGLSTWAACVKNDLIEGDRLDLAMGYFSPPKRILKRIGRIAAEGETRLVMAGKSDNALTIGASRSLYDYLLKKGAHVYEFDACKMHTKLLVLDDTVYIGSANFDMRSLYINLEIVLRIEDADFADRMRAYCDHLVQGAVRITPELHKRRATLWNRLRWNIGWLVVSVLDYTISRKGNLGL